MKNIFEVLKQKEDELRRLQNEVEALRIAARLLADDVPASAPQPMPTVQAPQTPVFVTDTPARDAAQSSGAYSAAWGNGPRQFP